MATKGTAFPNETTEEFRKRVVGKKRLVKGKARQNPFASTFKQTVKSK